MTPTDQQLKQALAKMLPELAKVERAIPNGTHLYWENINVFIKDTELLHLCWLVEETLKEPDEILEYEKHLLINGYWKSIHATWQQRTIALCKVKQIEIV